MERTTLNLPSGDDQGSIQYSGWSNNCSDPSQALYAGPQSTSNPFGWSNNWNGPPRAQYGSQSSNSHNFSSVPPQAPKYLTGPPAQSLAESIKLERRRTQIREAQRRFRKRAREARLSRKGGSRQQDSVTAPPTEQLESKHDSGLHDPPVKHVAVKPRAYSATRKHHDTNTPSLSSQHTPSANEKDISKSAGDLASGQFSRKTLEDEIVRFRLSELVPLQKQQEYPHHHLGQRPSGGTAAAAGREQQDWAGMFGGYGRYVFGQPQNRPTSSLEQLPFNQQQLHTQKPDMQPGLNWPDYALQQRYLLPGLAEISPVISQASESCPHISESLANRYNLQY